MKIVFSSISRLIFSYSKFLASLVLLSSIGTYAHSSEIPTYLKCNDRYYKLTGTSIKSQYNVRTKRFTYSSDIWSYTNDYIFFRGGRLNRNTGEWKVDGKVQCIVQKITFNDLPKLNAEGKLF
ncbi:hypothetical protein OA265_01875 [Candidatus Pelagibacter sp.]|nr:hypothetical protein [Candidatus Pelagibacter sp.]